MIYKDITKKEKSGEKLADFEKEKHVEVKHSKDGPAIEWTERHLRETIDEARIRLADLEQIYNDNFTN